LAQVYQSRNTQIGQDENLNDDFASLLGTSDQSANLVDRLLVDIIIELFLFMLGVETLVQELYRFNVIANHLPLLGQAIRELLLDRIDRDF